jgi:PAS domain S-box-containing protein
MNDKDRTKKQVTKEPYEFRRGIAELAPAKAKAKPKLAKELLRDRENIYKFLLDNSKEIILILSKRGKILFANRTILNSFGYSEEEIVGQSITSFLTRDSLRKSLYALAQEFLGHPQPEMEVRAKTKFGEIRYLKIAMGSAPIYDKGKLIGVIVCGSDITALRKTKEELREKEKRFRELWDYAPVAYHTLDINGIITDVNQTEARMLGYTKQEMVGKSIFAFILPEQRAEAQRRFQQKISGQKISRAESRMYVKRDGSKIYVAIDDALERDSDGKVISVRTTMVDITEQKEMEAVLKESEKRYKDLVEKAGIAILVDDKEGNFKYVNERCAEIFGYSVEEMKKQSIRSVVHPDDVERVMAYHEGRLQGKMVPSRYEFKGIRKDGSVIYLEVDSVALREGENLIGTRSYLWDFTERKMAMEALWESEEKFRNLAEQSPNMIFISRKGRVVYANEKCEKVTGYKREEIYSPEFDFLMLIAPEFRDMIIASFSKHMKGGEVPSHESTLRTKEGKRIEVILTTKLIDYEKEKAILGIITDISEQKKTEKIKDSIYRISEAAHSAQNLEELFRSIHNIIGELMPAKNFYIALYDYDREMLSFPYFADEYDETPAPKKPGKGLTEYVLRTGEPLLASPEVFEELVKKGKAERIGTPSIDWLGVPLKTENKTFGVMVVQSYTESVRFGEKDKEILKFVSAQTAMAIKRKHAEKQLKESLREKEVLLQEIHHRVKNNMQIISSLLNLQAGQMKDKDFIKMVKDSQSRIRSIALVHEKLYRSRDFSNINFSDYVQTLAVHLFQFNQVNSNLIQLKLNLEDVFLDLQTAIPCGLILNELVTNSLKHAFPEGKGGEIIIELHPLEEHTFQMVVKDNGVGIPEDLDIGNATSMGLQIVTILVNQLEGSMEVQREGGTTVKIIFKELRSKSRL